MSRHDHIGIFIDPLHGYRDPVLAGIARYIHARTRRWRPVVYNQETEDLAPLLAKWRGDGILYSATNDRMKDALARRRGHVPAVNVTGGLDSTPRSVVSDNHRIGVLAAEHLLERSLAHYAFVGRPKSYAHERQQGFVQRLQDAGLDCALFDSDVSAQAGIKQSLRRGQPVGVFCANDSLAMWLQQRCTAAGIIIPRDAAILGAGNWPALCDLAAPTLSSVDVDFESRGYHAAAMLDALMAGQTVSGPMLIPPRPVVVTRGSTAVFGHADHVVRTALQHIADNADRPISIDQLAAAVGVSRRKLEQRFAAVVGRTPHEEIWLRHVEAAKRLLADSDLSMLEVARRSGFSSASSFSTTFQRHTGRSPRAYRAEAASERWNPRP